MAAAKRKSSATRRAKTKTAAADDSLLEAGGREPRDIRDMAREHAAEAIARLTDWMRSDDARMSIAACNALLDRGFGKISQSGEAHGQLGIRHEDALALLK